MNTADYCGRTAVQYAAQNGDHVMLQQLIDAGADVNKANNVDGKTSLIEATSQNHPECANILIKAGASVNMANEKARTALIYAAEKGNRQTLTLLLEAGADVNKADNDHFTAVTICSNKRPILNSSKFSCNYILIKRRKMPQ